MNDWLEQIFEGFWQCLCCLCSQLSLVTWLLVGGFLLFFFMLLGFATHYLNNEIREVELSQARRSTINGSSRKRCCKNANSGECGTNRGLTHEFGVVDPNTTHITTCQLLREIHYAAGNGNSLHWTGRCIKLLQYYPKAVNHVMMPHKLTPFLRACSSGGRSLVHYMLLNGADISLSTADGDTAMILAVHSVIHNPADDLELLHILVKFGCNINIPKYNGCTPLHMAAKSGNINLIWWLLKCGANPKARTEQGWTPAHIAQVLGYEHAADLLSGDLQESKLLQIEMLNALQTNL